MREIAKVIGKGLKVPVVSLSPEEAQGTFWLACNVRRPRYAGLECANTRKAGMEAGWA